jgi:hypothetical protein
LNIYFEQDLQNINDTLKSPRGKSKPKRLFGEISNGSKEEIDVEENSLENVQHAEKRHNFGD